MAQLLLRAWRMRHIHQTIGLSLFMALSSACLDVDDQGPDAPASQATTIQPNVWQSPYQVNVGTPLFAVPSAEEDYWATLPRCTIGGKPTGANENGFLSLLKKFTGRDNSKIKNATDAQEAAFKKLLDGLHQIKVGEPPPNDNDMKSYLKDLDMEACSFSYKGKPGDAEFIFFHTKYKAGKLDKDKAHISFVWRLGSMYNPDLDDSSGQAQVVPLMVQSPHQGTDNIGATAVRFMIHSRALMMMMNAAKKDSAKNSKALCDSSREISDVGQEPRSLFHRATVAFVDKYPKSVLLNLHGKNDPCEKEKDRKDKKQCEKKQAHLRMFGISNGRAASQSEVPWTEGRPAFNFAKAVRDGQQDHDRVRICDAHNNEWRHPQTTGKPGGDCVTGNVGAIYIHNKDMGNNMLTGKDQCRHKIGTPDSGRFLYFEMPITWTKKKEDLVYRMAGWLNEAVRKFQ